LLQSVYPQLRDDPYYGKNNEIPGRSACPESAAAERRGTRGGIKKLVEYKPETWRFRIGKYRLFYVIDETDKIIYILSIDIRKDIF
jgi:mRNA interferase RelE/StbE